MPSHNVHDDLNVERPNKISRTTPTFKRACAERAFVYLKFLYYLFYWENNWIQTTRYELASRRLPAAFDGFVLTQVSDLHGKSFGRDSSKLLERVARERPNLVLITGDIVDEWSYDLEFVARFVAQIGEIAPVLYVTGNHEGNFHDEYLAATLDTIRRAGGKILLNERIALERDGNGARFVDARDPENAEERIVVAGVSDPIRAGKTYMALLETELRAVAEQDLKQDSKQGGRFQILMSHRPEAGDLYARFGFDVVFAGHAHGGQTRIPWLLPQGLIAPHQGWFPNATSGVKRYGDSTLVISRGLGPSVAPTRIFNRPELVVCKLRRVENDREEFPPVH